MDGEEKDGFFLGEMRGETIFPVIHSSFANIKVALRAKTTK